jgi:prepilin-type N-terminal cleavage/methylation domain-containing protein
MNTNRMHPGTSAAGLAERAFTLVELLVAIAVIGTLIGVIMPALSSANQQAGKVKDMMAMRQLLIGYQVYSSENAYDLLVGYYKNVPKMKLEDGFGDLVVGFDGQAKKRYPWRLNAFMDSGLRGTILCGKQESFLDKIPPAGEREWWHYRVSVMPSFGINAHFLGGYEVGGTPPPFRVCRTITEVRQPSNMIAFASARGEDWDQQLGLIAAEGWHTVDSPNWGHSGALGGMGARWSKTPYHDDSNPEEYGNISARYAGLVLIGCVDGHAEMSPPEDLRDMRLWSNDAARSGNPDWAPAR